MAWQSVFLAVGRNKMQLLPANAQGATNSPKQHPACRVFLRGGGLPRRSAPRNDMLKFAACPHMQERHIKQTCSVYAFSLAPHLLAPAETHPPSACHCELRPCTRARLPAFCMSLRASAHTGVAIRFPRRGTWQGGSSLGEFVTPCVFALGAALRYVLLQEKRIATSLRASQ